MRQNGADLSTPRQTFHYLYFGTERAARRAAKALARDDRTLDIHQTGNDWAVKIGQIMVVDEETIEAVGAEFEAIAEPEGGEYDGWEAAVE